ncbi:MAG TPA: hypothetical protein VMT76_12475 [Puia sp.]|nr:hypothetical protein [Puia sp.]
MRKIFAFTIIVAMLYQAFNNSFLLADYYLNMASYLKNCENKARPKMHCNGKCQVMKKIREQEKKDQENAESKGGNKYEVFSSKSFFATVHILSSVRRPSTIPHHYLCSKPSVLITDIFHPPQA